MRVRGGKLDQFVVGVPGVLSGEQGQPGDGIAMDVTQPCRMAGAAPFVQVLQDRDDLLLEELGLVERGPLICREPILTGFAAQEANIAVSSHEVVDGEIAAIADAVEFA